MSQDSMHALRVNWETTMENMMNRINELQTQLQTQREEKPTYKPQKPRSFHGKKDESIEAWLFQMERYFVLCKLEDSETRTQYATSYLEGNAALWWRGHVQETTQPIEHWQDLKTALTAQFKPVNASKLAHDRLAKLRQTSSVQVYIFAFRAILLE